MKKTILEKILSGFGFVKAETWQSFGGGSLGVFGSFKNSAKKNVTNENALTVSTVFACIRNISEDIAKLPLKIYRKTGDKRYDESSHRLARLLQYQPNPMMTAMSFRESLQAHAMGWGNGFAEIQRDSYGHPVALWPLRPDKVSVITDGGKRFYRVFSDEGYFVDINLNDMFHLYGLGADGVRGYNIISYMAQSVGSALAAEELSGAFYANGMHASGVLKHPKVLTKQAQERLADSYNKFSGGSASAGKMMIIEEGMEFTPISIDPKGSQMLETRQFSVSEFCRWLRVPPHKVADLTRATFSNIEEQNIDYVQDGLLGWLERWEQALWWKLLSDEEKDNGYYFKHIVEGLLRGNAAARYEGYSKMWDRGVLNINEIRAKEELNPIDGGDQHFIPANFVKLDEAGEDNQDEVIEDMSERIAKRETKEISERIKYANTYEFSQWLDSDVRQNSYDYIIKTTEPLGQFDICFEKLSMIPFLLSSKDQKATFEELKPDHASYVYNNLKGAYHAKRICI